MLMTTEHFKLIQALIKRKHPDFEFKSPWHITSNKHCLLCGDGVLTMQHAHMLKHLQESNLLLFL